MDSTEYQPHLSVGWSLTSRPSTFQALLLRCPQPQVVHSLFPWSLAQRVWEKEPSPGIPSLTCPGHVPLWKLPSHQLLHLTSLLAESTAEMSPPILSDLSQSVGLTSPSLPPNNLALAIDIFSHQHLHYQQKHFYSDIQLMSLFLVCLPFPKAEGVANGMG